MAVARIEHAMAITTTTSAVTTMIRRHRSIFVPPFICSIRNRLRLRFCIRLNSRAGFGPFLHQCSTRGRFLANDFPMPAPSWNVAPPDIAAPGSTFFKSKLNRANQSFPIVISHGHYER